MIADLHSHILPGIDDGSADVEESLAMLREEKAQGIGCVVATPHFYAQQDTPERFLARRAHALERLLAAAEEETLPELRLGAEVCFYRGMSDSDQLRALTIEGTPYILVEMPMSIWTNQMYQELADIRRKQGLIPIVAHVDRYIGPLNTHGIPARLEQLPVLVQANAGFFLRNSTRRMAMKLLNKEQIHLLGSDCHNMSARRPCLGEAVKLIEKALGPEALEPVVEYQNLIFGK